MLRFTCKFVASMFRNCWKEIVLVWIGMILCLCLLINYADSLFAIKNNYENATDEQAVMYDRNRIYFRFSDVEQFDEIIQRISGISGIDGVFLEGNVGVYIQSGTKLPFFSKNGLMVGKIPKKLQSGQAISSHDWLMVDEQSGESSPDEWSVMTENEEESVQKKEFLAQGEKFQIANEEFTSEAEVTGSDGHIVTIEDFIKLYRKNGQGELYLSYVFQNSFTEKQQKEVEKIVTEIKQPMECFRSVVAESVSFRDFATLSQNELLGLVIASLNALFLYLYLLKKRIPAYTILKLQGLTTGKLEGMLLLEFFVVYLMACVLSVLMYGTAAWMMGRQFVFTKEICLYSMGCLFVINLFLFLIVTAKLVRKQPFALYQQREP